MPIYKGSVKQKDIYIGSTKIGKVYKGSQLVYQSKLPAGQVIFESATPGTYTITIPNTQTYHIDLVGGGGGGWSFWGGSYNGGSAAYIYGDTLLTKGTYTLVIGSGGYGTTNGRDAGNGTSSSFIGNIAGYGEGASGNDKGYGGTATVVSSGLVGQNGARNSTAGWINGYGAGGSAGNSGVNGYCKIVAV